MIMIESFQKEELIINKKEVLRYLGYGKNDADENVLIKIETASEKLSESLSAKVCYEKYPLEKVGDELSFGMVKTESRSLKRNLQECEEAVVFSSTIGIGVDRLIGKVSAVSPLDAVIYQAIGTAYIEALCDAFCEKLGKMLEGKFLRPRFSPGYGDFGIENQKEIFDMLSVTRKIGVSLTESLQMVPSKSVTAIVGISPKDSHCNKKGCENCGNKDCEYRR